MSDDRSPPSPPPLNLLDPAAAGRATLLRLLRISLVTLVVVVVFFYIIKIGDDPHALGKWEFRLVTGWPYVLLFAFVLAGGVIAIDVLSPRKKISTLSGVFLGLVAGVLASFAVGFVIDLLAKVYQLESNPIITTIKVLVGIALAYLGVSIVLQTQDEFRLLIPYVEFSKQIRGPRPLLQDSSALIDGRILDLASTGLLQAPIIIPRFVLAELQALADSSDRMKRARGRRGLEMVTRLQRSPMLDVTLDETPIPGKSVDQMLVDLARRMPATIVTNDAALNRVAAIHGVAVINVNEVANALKPSFIPGETLRVRLIKQGEQAAQGVGYLEDGAMVVAEDGADHIGEDVTLLVTSSLQTAAGRLIFGRINERPEHAPREVARAAAAGSDDSAEPLEHRDSEESVDSSSMSDAPTTDASRPGHTPHAQPKKADKKRVAARNPRRG